MATGTHSLNQSAPSSPFDFNPASPEVSRIPRPAFHASPRTRRRSLTLEEAFDLAEHRRAIGSPSPAPRPPRQNQSSGSSDHRSLPRMFSQKPLDLGHLGKARPGSSLRRDAAQGPKDSFGITSHKGDGFESERDRKLKQFEEDEKIIKAMKEDKKGLFTRPKIGVNGAGSRAATAQGSSNGSLRNNTFGANNGGGDAPRQTWGTLHDDNPNWLKKFEPALKVAAQEDARNGMAGEKRNSPSASRFRSTAQQNPPLAMPQPATSTPLGSPNKSYAWQVDEDFTAGSLQVSNSPPVGFGQGNTKLEELRKLEIDTEQGHPVERHRFAPLRTNTRLDEILQREREIERKYPIPRVEEPTTDSIGDLLMNAEPRPRFSLPPPVKTDGQSLHRAEKAERPTNETLATRRLNVFEDEQAPRLPFSEGQRKANLDLSHQPNPFASEQARLQWQENNIGKFGGLGNFDSEKLPDDPVTIYRTTSLRQAGNEQTEPQRNGVPPAAHDRGLPLAKEYPHDLRKLAQPSSWGLRLNPAQENSANKAQEEDKAALSGASREDKQDERIISNTKESKSNGTIPAPLAGENKPLVLGKPTVGFAGIPRSSSTKSMRSTQSRASADPTARIEGEMNLFALADNMSERGAPSSRPESESGVEAKTNDADVTPRPPKVDPLSMPTPQVTGAYVETPVKIEQPETKVETAALGSNFFPRRKQSGLQNRDPSTSPRATRSDGQREHVRANSMSKLRRSKSLPRRRLPLKNTARPPTVKEDLKQIHMLNNIEDSTLDDFTDLIVSSSNPEELKRILRSGVTESEEMDDLTFEEQLKRFDQLGRSLNSGLAGIRQAKQGIERLENRVSNAERSATLVKSEGSQKHATGHHTHHTRDPGCAHCVGSQQKGVTAYSHIPVPRLFNTQPRFKPTLLGYLLLLLSSWYFLENAFYERWGRQYVCYRGSPCHYDVDDPDYGYVVPVKLDEWLTGGMIRPHAAHWLEEISDYYADVQDWWSGTDIRDVDWRAIRDPDWRRNHFRRMDKKNLWPEWKPTPEVAPMVQSLEHESHVEEATEAVEEQYYDARNDYRGDRTAKENVRTWYPPRQQTTSIIRWH
ncbi:hypothetical protein VPNG_01804 [Cytospora leucostoma]|uniref:Uncharacterized protein n=1 Tax=Cytospora leucostoma TaxID=1230097 RepID=A0A423XIG6_9PEZI|nr:hypothetical protein VPNG_01804 [Cytospora leucostoma]